MGLGWWGQGVVGVWEWGVKGWWGSRLEGRGWVGGVKG